MTSSPTPQHIHAPPPDWPPAILYTPDLLWPSTLPPHIQETYSPAVPPPVLLSTPANVTFDHDSDSESDDDEAETSATASEPPERTRLLRPGIHLGLSVLDIRRVPPVTVRGRVSVRKITDPSHPCHGAWGLFVPTSPTHRWPPCACEPSPPTPAPAIPKHSHILDYAGHVVSDADADADSDYLLHLVADLSVDAARAGNEGRCANDFRNVPVGGGRVASRPNACFDAYVDRATGEVRVGLFALRGLVAGEEVLVTYGSGYWKSRGVVLPEGLDVEWGEGWD
ncbi:hypothetical protein HDU96_009978 [Phlyctochytrium bullatum]|nr:hypothetical protein HDU96_009978 [Phlyctochytrium bullatum]